MRLWMRDLSITFSNGKKKITFGNNRKKGLPDFNINVQISKYMSPVKDEATIRITNLTYYEIVTLMEGKFTDVEIKAGYKETGSLPVFKGGVIYISNSLGNRKENTVIILCASDLVAKYQSRLLNLSLNSGINIYSALNAICKRAGIPNSNISPQFKKEFVQNVLTVNSTAPDYFNSLLQKNGDYFANSDSVNGSSFSIYNVTNTTGRVIPLNNNFINLLGGYPQLTSEGLHITVTPTFNFVCGDTIKIEKSLINMGVSSNIVNSKTLGYYLDEDGLYTIYQMTYNLTNRDSDFSINMLCKSRKRLNKVLGGTNV